jgi:hypothetical protein
MIQSEIDTQCQLALHGYDQRLNGACCWIKTKSLPCKKYMQSPDIQEVRNSLAQGLKHSACQKCWDDEDNGKISKRISINRNKNIEWKHADKGDLVYLSIMAGNTCNLACRTCGAHSSTGWFKEQKYADQQGYDMSYKGEVRLKEFQDNIDVPLDKLRQIEILGGEPFYELTHLKFIERLCKEADPSKIELFYSTNGTKQIDPNIKKMFERFKRITVSFSIDAVGKPFEYIRTLGKWDQVEQNISYWSKFENIRIQNHATLSVLNIMYFKELHNYFTEVQGFEDQQLSYTYAAWPVVYNFSVVDENKKQKYKEQIMENLTFGRHTSGVQSYFNSSTYNHKNYENFLREIQITKEFRKLDIADYLPETCRILEL